MFFTGNKNRHPAASGRFASYEEIISNFSVMALPYKSCGGSPGSSVKTKAKPSLFKSVISRFALSSVSAYSFIPILLLSLILAVTAVLLINNNTLLFFASSGNLAANRANTVNRANPANITAEYLTLWLFLFIVLSFVRSFLVKNSIKNPKGFNLKNFKNFSEEEFRRNKPFELGVLKGGGNSCRPGRKYGDVLIGLSEKKRFEHILVVSPTGGGKTSRYIIPGITADAGYCDASVFAIDIDSPYLYESVKESWKKAGKKVVLFDPFDDSAYTGGSGISGEPKICFNPLTGKDGKPLSDEKLFNLSSMLFHIDKMEIKSGDVHAHKYYSKRSSDLFYGSLLYLKYRYGAKYFDLYTVKAFFERGVKFIEGEILKLNGEDYKKIKNLFNNFLELPVYERAKIVTDVLNALDFLSGAESGIRFKCKEDKEGAGSGADNGSDNGKNRGAVCFFLEDFFTEDTLFIAGIPKEKINSGGGRLISFITQIFIDGIYEYRRESLRASSSSDAPRSFFIYLDEFPVLTLNDFDTELANLRKTNTGVCMTVQDVAFLKDRYGDISLIASNIGTHIVMGHAGWETCRYYSEMSGERYVLHKEFVKKDVNPVFAASFPLFNGNYNETAVASGLYPLISPDGIKNLDDKSVFIYTKYIGPFILNLRY